MCLLLRLMLRRRNCGRRKDLFYSNSQGRPYSGPLTGNRLFLHGLVIAIMCMHDVDSDARTGADRYAEDFSTGDRQRTNSNFYCLYHWGTRTNLCNHSRSFPPHTSLQQSLLQPKRVCFVSSVKWACYQA